MIALLQFLDPTEIYGMGLPVLNLVLISWLIRRHLKVENEVAYIRGLLDPDSERNKHRR